MSTPKIKFDLQIKYGTEYGPEEEVAVLEVLRQGAPTSGEACIQFERDFAAYCGTSHARAVSNGTAALFLSLVALAALPGSALLAQDLTGTWQGTLQLPNGKELRTVIKVTKADGGALRGTMFSIDQGAGAIPINPVTLQGTTVKMSMLRSRPLSMLGMAKLLALASAKASESAAAE